MTAKKKPLLQECPRCKRRTLTEVPYSRLSKCRACGHVEKTGRT